MEGQIADQAAKHGIKADEVLERVLLQRTATRRLIEPDEVAAVVRWLRGQSTAWGWGFDRRLAPR